MAGSDRRRTIVDHDGALGFNTVDFNTVDLRGCPTGAGRARSQTECVVGGGEIHSRMARTRIVFARAFAETGSRDGGFLFPDEERKLIPLRIVPHS